MGHGPIKSLRSRPYQRERHGVLVVFWMLVVGMVASGCQQTTGGGQSRFCPAGTECQSRAEVPFEIVAGHILLKVQVPSGERCMMLDTGAAGVMVSPALAQAESMPVLSSNGQMVDAGGNRTRSEVLELASLSLGDVHFTRVPAMQQDLSGISHRVHRTVDLVGGLPLFRDLLLTVDYSNRKLVLEQGELPSPQGEVLSMQRAAGGRLLLPLNVAGREIWATPDTGATGGVICPDWANSLFPEFKSAMRTGNTMYWGGEGITSVAKVNGTMTIAQVTVQDPVITFTGRYDPLVGYELLSNFAMTIDQRNARVRLRQTCPRSVRLPGPLIPGFAVNRQARIIAVLPGSGAEQAGLKVGDQVVALNGQPLTAAPQSFGGPVSLNDTMTITIDRNGRRMDLAMVLTPMLR